MAYPKSPRIVIGIVVILLSCEIPFAATIESACGSVQSWECIPGIVRNDGVESFRIEIDAGRAVSYIRINSLSPRLLTSQTTPIEFRDDGRGEDRTAGDFVYTAGPFRYNTAIPMANWYLNDPNSPAGLDVLSVGAVTIHETNGVTARFLISPSIGILNSSIPPTRYHTLPPDLILTPHLINIRGATRDTQRFLRGAGGDISLLSRTIFTVAPDVADFLVFFSTDKVEHASWSDSRNFTAGTHESVRVNYTGAGQPLTDYSYAHGSRSILAGVNVIDAYDRGVTSLNVTHEILHQWSFFGDSSLGLGDGLGHYNPRSNIGSLLGGYQWNAGDDGGYTLDCTMGMNGTYRIAPLDLYFMGLLDASMVPPIHIYSEYSPPPLQRCGQNITDITRTVTIQDIIQSLGTRTPSVGSAQSAFRIVFAAESHHRLMTPTELTYYEILASHYTRQTPAENPDPYIGFNWAPIDRFYGGKATWHSTLSRYGDMDGDGDVDMVDHDRFMNCYSSSPTIQQSRDCACADFDRDLDVDGNDFNAFAACFNGPDQPPQCAPRFPLFVRADTNMDNRVDAIDFDVFSACYNGPNHPASGNCLLVDYNNDHYVDANDFDIFSDCYNGPATPPRCH